MSLFKLRGTLSPQQSLGLGLAGFLLVLGIWWLLAEAFAVQRPVLEEYTTRIPTQTEAAEQGINLDSLLRADSLRFANATEFTKVYPILPTPVQVIQSYPSLVQEDELVYNTALSIWRNLQGYFWAIALAVPLGFLIGLLPLFRGLFSKQVDAMRYLPLTALVGIFITWFGIEERMKIAFLAFGVIVYLLPVVIQRIHEVQEVYLKTTFTLGATDWQTIRTVYLPSVMSKLIDDIRVLTAISWTYIIIAELLNKQGGIGALIYNAGRRGQVPDVFAILILIIAIGFLQDRIFAYLDKRLFPYKYYKTAVAGIKEIAYGIYILMAAVAFLLLAGIFIDSPSILSGLQTAVLLVALASMVLIVFGELKTRQMKNA